MPDKVEEIERLVGEFRAATAEMIEMKTWLHDTALRRSHIVRQMSQYLTYVDIAHLLGMGTSNVGRLIRGPVE